MPLLLLHRRRPTVEKTLVSYRAPGCRWPWPGSWCSKGSPESPNGSETCPLRLAGATAPWAPCSCGLDCGGESPGAGCSARRDGAPSTETDQRRLRPPWLSSASPLLNPPVSSCAAVAFTSAETQSAYDRFQIEIKSSSQYSPRAVKVSGIRSDLRIQFLW